MSILIFLIGMSSQILGMTMARGGFKPMWGGAERIAGICDFMWIQT